MKTHTFLVAALTLLLGACSQQPDKTLSGLNPADFATVVDGKQVALYTLKNASGMEVLPISADVSSRSWFPTVTAKCAMSFWDLITSMIM